MKLFIIVLLGILIINLEGAYGSRFWPYPANVTFGTKDFLIDPCSINYKISTIPVHFLQIKQFYLIEVFKCTKQTNNKINKQLNLNQLNVTLTVIVTNTSLLPPFANYQNYTLNATDLGNWTLRADYYPGFLRGFQTFSQLFKWNDQNGYYVEGLPTFVRDYPQYQWRGIMIDTARHYLSVGLIKRTIEACLYNKVNVLHWHITDEDSFPLQIQSHPELTKYGSFKNKTYSKSDVKEIVQYALRRGVRVIPEIDTPAHTQAWGRSPQLSGITLNCDGMYQGQFDPTLQKTYTVLTDVLKQVNDMFIDPVMHFGGDEVDTQCWDLRPSIKQWMNQNNIKDYEALQTYYRQKQKAIWKTISNRSVSYWANQQINLPAQDSDYLHWWGDSQNANQIANRSNKIIFSFYDQTYLDIGFGGAYGEGYGIVQTWQTIYHFNPRVFTKGRVIGGEACLWSQLNNQNTQMRKLWLRAAALVQRLWNSGILVGSFNDIADRLNQHGKRLRRRGIPFTPITTRLCEDDASFCYI